MTFDHIYDFWSNLAFDVCDLYIYPLIIPFSFSQIKYFLYFDD